MEKKKKTPRIQVVLRKRPRSEKENQRGDKDILEYRGKKQIVVQELKQKVDLTKFIEEHSFIFDRVYGEEVDNQELYETSVKPLVKAAMSGTKVTCFAYGQTGSGKTYTMMGDQRGGDFIPGIFFLAAQEIFDSFANTGAKLTLWVSFYEIYCGKLFDLLNERQELFAREDGKQNICIVGLIETQVTTVAELMEIMVKGLGDRTTGVTGANIDSSRSHAVLQINFKEQNGRVFSKLGFIDLAGSERGADTLDQNRQTRMDGAEINKSLLALKECIRALDMEHRHTPFRGSKLTLVLKDSFIGNCQTLMIANVSPTQSCCEHTLNTLRYADRVKELTSRKPGQSMGGHPASSEFDQLSSNLMLARQYHNTSKKNVKSNGKHNLCHSNTSIGIPRPQTAIPHPTIQKMGSGDMVDWGVNNGNHGGNHVTHGNHALKNAIPNILNNKPLSPPPLPSTQVPLQMNYNSNTLNGANNTNTNIHNRIPANASKIGLGIPNGMRIEYNNQNNQGIVNQNKNPNIHSSGGVQINTNMNSIGRLNENLKNIGNIITNTHVGDTLESTACSTNTANSARENHSLPNIKALLRHSNESQIPRPNFNKVRKIEESVRGTPPPPPVPLVPPPGEWGERSEDELQKLCSDHENLVNIILEEEEKLIDSHRKHVDHMVELVRQEMMLLQEVDKPGSDVDEYVSNLDAILAHKMEAISLLRSRLLCFHEHLMHEEKLSHKFYEQQHEILDVFDLKDGNKQDISDGHNMPACRDFDQRMSDDIQLTHGLENIHPQSRILPPRKSTTAKIMKSTPICCVCEKTDMFFQAFPTCECVICFNCLRDEKDWGNNCELHNCNEHWYYLDEELADRVRHNLDDRAKIGDVKCKWEVCKEFFKREEEMRRREHEKKCVHRTELCERCGRSYIIKAKEYHDEWICKVPVEEDDPRPSSPVTDPPDPDPVSTLPLIECPYEFCTFKGDRPGYDSHIKYNHQQHFSWGWKAILLLIMIIIFSLLFFLVLILYITK